jgi:hypothetical protein
MGLYPRDVGYGFAAANYPGERAARHFKLNLSLSPPGCEDGQSHQAIVVDAG